MNERSHFYRLVSIALLLTLFACGDPTLAPDEPTPRPTPTPTPTPAVCHPGEFLDEVFPEPLVQQDVFYSRVTDRFGTHDLVMDIYQPNGDTRPNRPAIVWVHGGGFETGSKSQLREFAQKFGRRGYVSAAIQYRLLRVYDPNASARTCAEVAQSDAQAAVRFLRAHAVDLALDQSRIAIGGYSAGSITAFHVGYRYESVGDNRSEPGQSHTVAAVVGMDSFLVAPADLRANDPPFTLFRAELTRDDDESDAIPNLLAAADALGIHRELHVVRDAGHANMFKPPFSQFIIDQAAPFLRRHVACR